MATPTQITRKNLLESDPLYSIKKKIYDLADSGALKLSTDEYTMLNSLADANQLGAWLSGRGFQLNADQSITEIPQNKPTPVVGSKEWFDEQQKEHDEQATEDVVIEDPAGGTIPEGPRNTQGQGSSQTPFDPYKDVVGKPKGSWWKQHKEEKEEKKENEIPQPTGFDDIFSQRPKYEIPQEVFDMLTEYQTGAQKLEDLYGRSRTEILSEARKSGKLGLEATKRYGEDALDIMRTRAYGGLPGERQYYEQLGATTAGAVRDITQRGGGGSQGALADIYGQQMSGQRDIMAQRAQYQAGGMENLAGLTRQTGLDLSNQYRTMAQDYINANLAGTQGLGQAYQAGTAMRTAGLGNMANYRDTAWNINQYQPALAREASYIDQMNKYQDMTYNMEMAQYGSQTGQAYNWMGNAYGGYTNAYQGALNSVQQGLGGIANIGLLNSWYDNNEKT